MKPTRAVLLIIFLAGVGGSIVSTTIHQRALASRNSSGVYSLPSGNPVVSGTTITSTWANGTLSDLGTEVTNSLDRNGRGAMLAPLPLASGAVSAPGLTFSSEASSGLYRAGAGDVRMSVLSTDVEKYANTGVTFPLAATVTGTATINGAFVSNAVNTINTPFVVRAATFLDAGVSVNGALTADGGVIGIGTPVGGAGGVFQGGSTSGNGVVGFGGPGSNGVIGIGGSAGGTGGNFTGTGGGVAVLAGTGGLQIGTSGTTISASYSATYSPNVTCTAGSIANIGTQTLTGAATTAVCNASTDTDINGHAMCTVSSANTVTLYYCCHVTFGATVKNIRVRVWQ